MRQRGRNNALSSKWKPDELHGNSEERSQRPPLRIIRPPTTNLPPLFCPRRWFWGRVPWWFELGNSAAALITQDPATPVQDEGKKRDRGPPADSRDGDQVGVLAQSLSRTDGVPPAFMSSWCVMQFAVCKRFDVMSARPLCLLVDHKLPAAVSQCADAVQSREIREKEEKVRR